MQMKIRQLLFALAASALLLSPVILKAQAQQDSVADAARKARAAKKTSAKPAVVYTDDNLDTIKGAISVVGEAPAPPPATADKAKTDAAAGQKPAAGNDETAWRQRFADARKKLADDQHELDVDQRDYNLKRQQFYSDPTVALKEQYSNDDLNNMKKTIDDLTATVDKDKQAVSDLDDALRQAGGDPGWSREP
jgi:hypothetical protein